MKPAISITIFLFRQLKDKNDQHPTRLVIYHAPSKKKKRYATGHNLSDADWIKINAPNLKNPQLKKIKAELDAIRLHAEQTVESLPVFSFEAFEAAFFKKTQNEVPIIREPLLSERFELYLSKLKENGQVGTMISYRTTINSIEAFHPKLKISQVTLTFLEEYEKHLLNSKKSPTTVGIYMRQLRAIINQAIKDRVIPAEDYPFVNYNIPASRNIKKALSEMDILKLLNFETDNPVLRKALDLWLLSYLCNGMNFADIAYLKPENLDGNLLSFARHKTMRTKKRDLTPIRVGIHPLAMEIINKYRCTNGNPYLFPFLKPTLTLLQEKYRIQQLIRFVNKHMESIRSLLDIQDNLGTYTARHTFSTVLKRKGVSTSYIKEALGHSSEAITESYLASFEDHVKLEYANKLTDFPQPTTSENTINL